MKYPLAEIFESLQGEGRNTGRPCVFVRFAGCNLCCPWCDTDVTKRFELSLDDLVAEVLNHRARSVILTGGEPTIQRGMPELVSRLKDADCWIGVETNGLCDVDWLQFVDYVACSPKAEFAERYAAEDMLRVANEVRVVASSDDVVSFCEEIRSRITATDYYVSPCDHEGGIDLATAKSVLNRLSGWSLSVQLHKLLGFR